MDFFYCPLRRLMKRKIFKGARHNKLSSCFLFELGIFRSRRIVLIGMRTGKAINLKIVIKVLDNSSAARIARRLKVPNKNRIPKLKKVRTRINKRTDKIRAVSIFIPPFCGIFIWFHCGILRRLPALFRQHIPGLIRLVSLWPVELFLNGL